MIHFFRKIRQKLLTHNKLSKYFVYAFGEIILVVIGILIALQINNWNEQNKLHAEEVKLIKALTKEIESNLKISKETTLNNDSILINSTKMIQLHEQYGENKFTIAAILEALGYNTNKTQIPILTEILETNARSLIQNDSLISKLRILKSAFDRSEKTQDYADEFWNTQVVSFINNKGLGVYLPAFKHAIGLQTFYKVDDAFFSLVGIMNAYQQGLLYSRQELDAELEETLKFIQKQIILDKK